jgi:uncharacterized protein DUF3823
MKQKYKISTIIMLLAAASLLVQSCGKDNVKYPTSTLSGHFTYNGQKVGMLFANPDLYFGAGTGHNLAFQQVSGKQNVYGSGEINVYAQHDGSFTSKFFDGDYVYRTLGTKNPFEDIPVTTTPITIKGDTQLEIPVVPYWWMTGLATTFTGGTGGATGVFTATFTLTKVSTATARTLDRVFIYLSPTNRPDAASAVQGAIRSFVAGTNSNGNVVPAAASAGGTVTVKVDLAALSSTTSAPEKQFLTTTLGTNAHIWATVAVKTTGITDALYSDPIQLQ